MHAAKITIAAEGPAAVRGLQIESLPTGAVLRWKILTPRALSYGVYFAHSTDVCLGSLSFCRENPRSPGDAQVGGGSGFSLNRQLANVTNAALFELPLPELKFGALYYFFVVGTGFDGNVGRASKYSAEFLQPCPKGGYCGEAGARGDEVVATNGWWRASWGPEPRLQFFECTQRRQNCLGVVAGAKNGTRRSSRRLYAAEPYYFEGCAEGYAGALCLACTPGYSPSGAWECSECISRGAMWAILIIGCAVALAVCVYLIHSTITSEGKAKDVKVSHHGARA